MSKSSYICAYYQISMSKSLRTIEIEIKVDLIRVSSRLNGVDPRTIKEYVEYTSILDKLELNKVNHNTEVRQEKQSHQPIEAEENDLTVEGNVEPKFVYLHYRYDKSSKIKITRCSDIETIEEFIALSKHKDFNKIKKKITTKDLKKWNYYFKVWVETELNADKIKNIECRSSQYVVDHIIPIIYGFKNNINPSLIGHANNLQIIDYKENLLKAAKINEHTIYNQIETILNSSNKIEADFKGSKKITYQ